MLFAAACTQAPEFSGADQVHDPNVNLTALKDNYFEQMSWEDVDNVILNELVSNPSSEPGCAVGIVRDGEILYLQGYGYAQMPSGGSPGQPWGVSTMGAVGSISKTITAAAMLSMVDDGDLALDELVWDHLATTNAPLGDRTLESLITHTSGIGGPNATEAFSPDFEASSGASDCQSDPDSQPVGYCDGIESQLASPLAAFSMYEASEQVSFFPVTPLPTPGIYSNVGISVAGAVIDEVAQASTSSDGYESYVWNNIGQWSNNLLEGGHLYSLALTHSWRDTDIPNRAIGYGDVPNFPVLEAWQGVDNIEGWEGPSGGWAMTIGDLARFMIALDEAAFFDDPSFRDLMHQPHTDLPGTGSVYGMGMFVGNGSSTAAHYRHGGDIAGHHAYWAWWDDYQGHDIGIGLMCNRDDMTSNTLYNAMIWESGEQSEEFLLWLAANQNPDPPSAIVFAPIANDDIEGADFQLDPEGAWLAGGQQLALPFDVLVEDLFLSVERFESSSSGPTFHFGQGGIGQNGELQIPHPVQLTSMEYENPSFATRPVSMTLGNGLGSVYVQNMILEGAFSEGGKGKSGKSIEALSLSGLLDTRQAAALLAYDQTSRDACRDVRLAGGECVPCADGEPVCFEFRYENLVGVPVPEPGLAVAALIGAGFIAGIRRRV